MVIFCPGYYVHIMSRVLCSYYVQVIMVILCPGYYVHILSRVLCSYYVQVIMFILSLGKGKHTNSARMAWVREIKIGGSNLYHLVNH